MAAVAKKKETKSVAVEETVTVLLPAFTVAEAMENEGSPILGNPSGGAQFEVY